MNLASRTVYSLLRRTDSTDHIDGLCQFDFQKWNPNQISVFCTPPL